MDEKQKLAVFIAARPHSLEQLLKLCEASSRLSVAGTATDGESCISKLSSAADCRIALIDYALPRISGVKVVEYFAAERPEIISVLAAEQSNPDFFRGGMLAGAREFLILPLTTTELEFSLERVAQISTRRAEKRGISRGRAGAGPSRDGQFIAVCAGKGGVGVSFVAANLAVAAARRAAGLMMALVDMNFSSGDLAAVLDIRPTRTLCDLAPAIPELEPELLKAASSPVFPGLDLYPAPVEIEAGPVFTPDQLQALLECLRRSYDLVVTDVGSTPGAGMVGVLSLADLILCCTVPEVLSVRGCKRLIEWLDKAGVTKSNMAAVINCRNSFDLSADRLAGHLGIPAIGELPSSREVPALLDEGRQITAVNDGALSRAMDRLTQDVFKKLKIPEVTVVK